MLAQLAFAKQHRFESPERDRQSWSPDRLGENASFRCLFPPQERYSSRRLVLNPLSIIVGSYPLRAPLGFSVERTCFNMPNDAEQLS